ncbi:MAG: alpha/beta hydrolase-fold protein [Candidatus Hodarchaeales archaeon]|jgi:enterochelin esterase-like enzyme
MQPLQLVDNEDTFKSFQNLLLFCKNTDLDSKEKNEVISNFISLNEHNYPFRKNNEVYLIYFGPAELINVVGDFNGWDFFDESSKMIKIPDTDLFYLKKSFELDSRLDYQFVVDTDWILDPLNSRKLLGGFGYNSELVMPSYSKNILFNEKEIPRGTIKEINFESETQKNWSRKIFVYLPPKYNSQSDKVYPSFYAVDGTDYLLAGNASQILDEFIHQERIPPLIGIFIDPLTPSLRIRDFNGKNCREEGDSINYLSQSNVCKDRYCEFLKKELIPHIDKNYKTINNGPDQRAHLGVSLGGILSAYIGSKYSDLFGLIGSQSGAFWIDTPVYESFEKLNLKSDMKFYLNAGTFEKRNYNHTKRFAEILKKKNYLVREEYYNQGHSWGLWKETFGNMLEYLFSI